MPFGKEDKRGCVDGEIVKERRRRKKKEKNGKDQRTGSAARQFSLARTAAGRSGVGTKTRKTIYCMRKQHMQAW